MTWWTVGTAAVSLVGNLASKNASSSKTSGGTSGFCACVQAGTKQAIQTAESVANQPFQGYCVNNAVAGLTCNQLAAQKAAETSSQYLPGFQATAGEQFNPQTLAQYESPYVNNVLSAQNALASKNYQTQMACLNAKQGMTSAFGGDRSAIAGSQLTQNYNLNTNLNNATGLNNAYTQGVSAFNQDRSYAAGQTGQIEGALASTGGVAQQTNQNKANFNYNQFCQQRNWTKNQNAYLTQTLAQVPKGQYYTGNQTSTTIPAGGGWGGALAGAAGIANMGHNATTNAPAPSTSYTGTCMQATLCGTGTGGVGCIAGALSGGGCYGSGI